MATGIDHVVIVVNDLETSSKDFRAAGFTVVPGGEHANGETHNALVAFSDGSYFELIAWKDPATASEHQWLARSQNGEGLVDFALRTEDLQYEIERLRAKGLVTPDPTPGGRTRPDGERVEWLNLRFDPEQSPWLPFYCHSTNDRGLRVPSGQHAVHANGASSIASITIGVSDLVAAERDFAIVSGIEYTPESEDSKREFAVGRTRVVLVASDDAESELGHPIAWRGNVPMALELSTTNPTSVGPLDITLTHGAPITLIS